MLQANVLDVWRKHFVLEENMLEVGLRHSLVKWMSSSSETVRVA